MDASPSEMKQNQILFWGNSQMAKSKIEWCDFTFNPWIGCQVVSEGCKRCYAESMARRWKWATWGAGEARRLTSDLNWKYPLTWNNHAIRDGVRYRVFCASLADVFDEWAPAGARERLWALIKATPALDWMLLTKRPHHVHRMLPADWGDGYENVWLGMSAEDQANYDYRWPALSAIPARIRFVSYEPALGPLTIPLGVLPDWVIAGGESGPGARCCWSVWFENIRDECALMGIPFLFKQWGKYENNPLFYYHAMNKKSVRWFDPPENGKGGALLNGVLHRAFPS